MRIEVKIFIGFIFLALALKPIMAQDISTRDTTYILDIAWSPDGTQIAAVGIHPSNQAEDRLSDTYGYLSVIDATSGNPTFIVDRPAPFTSVAWSPDGQYLALGSYDTTVWIVDATTGERITSLFGHDATVVVDVAWSSDGTQIVSIGDWDEQVILWDAITYAQIAIFSTGVAPRAVAFTPDNENIALGTEGGLYIFPKELPTNTHLGRDYFVMRIRLSQLTYSPNGQYLAIGRSVIPRITTGERSNASTYILNAATNVILHHHESPLGSIIGLSWDPTNQYLAIYHEDNIITLMKRETGEVEAEYHTHGFEQFRAGLAFSPYGGRLAVGQWIDSTISRPQIQGAIVIDNEAFSAADSPIQIIIPDPSLDLLQSIAELCGAPLDLQSQSRETIISHVETLDIPPACRADLFAVAHALQEQY